MRLIDFAGARRIALVGRRDLLAEVGRRIGRGGVHLIYVEGGGGIGKTALLEAMLEKSQRGVRANDLPACRVAQEIVDFYHVDVHTSEGLIRRLIDVLGKWSFEQSQEVLEALDQARIVGDMDMASRRAEALRLVFLEEFAPLTEEGLVLALDTLEVLEYEHDPFQEELGVEVPILSAGQWLFHSFLPALQGNVVVLLAGRPCGVKERLADVHQHHPRILVQHVPLAALTEAETREYLQAIAQAEGQSGDADAAARLWAFGQERGEVVHHLTGGRPILLALVADMVARGWVLPTPFGRSLADLQKQGARTWWPEIERALVVRIQESPTPVGDTIRALAWLRKGATPELLARVMDMKTSDGQWDIYTATGYLDQVSELALVKVRPGTRRVFLHDEMYALLESHVLQATSLEEKDRIYAAIRDYFRDLIRDLERRIEQFPPMLVLNQARLRRAQVEEMHYRLRHSPPLGFAIYFWLAEEAIGGRDAEMDMLVRTEFLRTLGRLREEEIFVGLVPREAEVDTAVRWGMRALFLQNDPEEALAIFDMVRRRWGRDARRLGLAWIHLQLYQAAARIRRATGEDWPEARAMLNSVEQQLDAVLRTPPETPVVRGRIWRARILKSLALNYRGYLDRQQGRYIEAVQHYQESAMLQRRLRMAALAPTLTNLAYAMALIGQTSHARLLAEEAERLAQRSGREHMLALTLNVRALVEGFDDHHRAALRYTERAMEVAARLPTRRIRGLVHLSRARAYRYLWNSFTEPERRRESSFLDDSLKDANQAVSLLRNNPADRVDALLERGCVCRELSRMYHGRGEREESKKFARRSCKDLERAAVLAAAIDLRRQQALAWTNMGWLYYYVDQKAEMQQAIAEVYDLFPSEYLFPPQGLLPQMARNGHRKEATLPYWSTLGKIEMLQAFVALDEILQSSEKKEREDRLKVAVEHITLSLAYDELVAEAYFDLTRAEEQLHKRILRDAPSIRGLHLCAQQVAHERGLQTPTRFQSFLDRMFGTADLWI